MLFSKNSFSHVAADPSVCSGLQESCSGCKATAVKDDCGEMQRVFALL